VAVGEILQNIIRYAVWKHRHEGRITIRLCPDYDGFKVHILDDAAPGQCDDWYKSAEAKRPTEGGLGLKLVSRATDAVSFTHTDKGNQVVLIFHQDKIATHNAKEELY